MGVLVDDPPEWLPASGRLKGQVAADPAFGEIYNSMTWGTQANIDAFGPDVYEHDVKLFRASGLFDDDDFWATRWGLTWTSTFPLAAMPYFDTANIEDPSDVMDLTLGLFEPTQLSAGVTYETWLNSLRGNEEVQYSEFALVGQKLSPCPGEPDPICVGVDYGTGERLIAQSDACQVPGTFDWVGIELVPCLYPTSDYPIARVQQKSTYGYCWPSAPGTQEVTLDRPPTSGNLLIIVAAAKGGATINLRVDTPGGWTQLDRSPPGIVEAGVWYKISDGTESIIRLRGDGDIPVGTQGINFWVGEYRGVYDLVPVDVWTSNGKEGSNASTNIYTGATDEPYRQNGLYLYSLAVNNAGPNFLQRRHALAHGASAVNDAGGCSAARAIVYERTGSRGYEDTAHAHLYFGNSQARHIRAWAIVFRPVLGPIADDLAAPGGTSTAEQIRGNLTTSVSSASFSWSPFPSAGRRLVASVRTIASSSGVTHSGPPGWSQVGITEEIRYRDTLDGYIVESIWTKVAAGNETTATWTFSEQVSLAQVIGLSYSGMGNIASRGHFDAHLGHYSGASRGAEAATGRAHVQSSSVVLSFLSTDDRTGPISTATNGWIVDGSIDGGNFGRIFVLRRNTSSSGDVVTRVEFDYGSSTRVGELIATNIVIAGAN